MSILCKRLTLGEPTGNLVLKVKKEHTVLHRNLLNILLVIGIIGMI